MRLIDADALKLSDFQDFSNTDVMYAIDHAPTIEPVKRGEWEIDSIGERSQVMKCSKCKHTIIVALNIPLDEWKESRSYCHKCGADMREESKHE